MKRILGLTTAALMGASVLAAPALAEQDFNLDATGGADATQEQSTMPDAGGGEMDTGADFGVDTGTTAAIDGSFDGALSAIGGNDAQAIGTLDEVATVNVVRIIELEGSDPAAVDQAVSENNAEVDELRNTIAGNPALSDELATQGVDVSSVVAAEVEANGEVTVYVM